MPCRPVFHLRKLLVRLRRPHASVPQLLGPVNRTGPFPDLCCLCIRTGQRHSAADPCIVPDETWAPQATVAFTAVTATEVMGPLRIRRDARPQLVHQLSPQLRLQNQKGVVRTPAAFTAVTAAGIIPRGLLCQKTLVRAETCVRQLPELHHQGLQNEKLVRLDVRPLIPLVRRGRVGSKEAGRQKAKLEPRVTTTHHRCVWCGCVL